MKTLIHQIAKHISDKFNGLWEESTAWLEFILGVGSTFCGLYVLVPFPIHSPPFQMLGHSIPESYWGSAMVLTGLWQIVCSLHRNCARCALAATLGIFQWLHLSYATIMADPLTLTMILYLTFVLGWIIVLAKQPLEIYDRLFDRLEKTRIELISVAYLLL